MLPERILFLDGSGDPTYPPPFQKSSCTYFAFGGILATPAQIADLNGRIEAGLAAFFPDGESSRVEIHAHEIFLNPALRPQRRWGPWQKLPGPERREFVESLIENVRGSRVQLFGRVVNKRQYLQSWRDSDRNTGQVDPEPPIVNTCRFLLRDVDRYLARHTGTCQVIFDRDTFERELQEMIATVVVSGHHTFGPWVADRVSAPSRFSRLGPYSFEDSRVHRCLQAADFVANLVWRTSEKNQGQRFSEIRDLFPSWDWHQNIPPGNGLSFYKLSREEIQRYR